MQMNSEGLTYFEWKRAANFARKNKLGENQAKKAWEAGEDPCDHAIEEEVDYVSNEPCE